jgi:hypothetical protein
VPRASVERRIWHHTVRTWPDLDRRTSASHRAHCSSGTCRRNEITRAAIRSAAKQLSARGTRSVPLRSAASREMSLMLPIPYPKRSRTDLKRRSKGRSGPETERSEARETERSGVGPINGRVLSVRSAVQFPKRDMASRRAKVPYGRTAPCGPTTWQSARCQVLPRLSSPALYLQTASALSDGEIH